MQGLAAQDRPDQVQVWGDTGIWTAGVAGTVPSVPPPRLTSEPPPAFTIAPLRSVTPLSDRIVTVGAEQRVVV